MNILNILYAYTLGIAIINFIRIFSIIIGKDTVRFGKMKYFDPTNNWWFYPSFFYQVYWWSLYFNIISL